MNFLTYPVNSSLNKFCLCLVAIGLFALTGPVISFAHEIRLALHSNFGTVNVTSKHIELVGYQSSPQSGSLSLERGESPASSFVTGSSQMDRVMRGDGFLEVARHPQVLVYDLRCVTDQCQGVLEIKGIRNAVSGTLSRQGLEWSIKTKFRLSDFRMEGRALLGIYRLRNQVDATIRLSDAAKKFFLGF